MFKSLQKQAFRSAMKLDPAVIELLKLDPDNTTVSSAGGGGCSSASTSKITSKLSDGTEKLFFMKTGRGKDANIMFEGMYSSNLIGRPLIIRPRRARLAQRYPLCSSLPLPRVFRTRPILITILNTLPRYGLPKFNGPCWSQRFRTVARLQTR